MGKQLRYMGKFLSRNSVEWRVEILQEADTPFASVGNLTFEADEALVIEWKQKAKDEVICGSSATLRIESPGDRTYEDLYSIEVGRVRMDVYRENKLYWSGTLDPEFYEEPYEKLSHYTVELTFSDFGILDREKYDLANMQKVGDIVSMAISRSGINVTGIDQTLITTALSANGAALKLNDLKVRSDNFFDEDGEASTLAEVIEGIFQPLALKMVQRNGKVYVYDLNGLYTLAERKAVVWDGESSTMGVDRVYNNALITWNTYAQGGVLTPEDCWTESVSESDYNMNSLTPKYYGDSLYYSYHYATDLWDWIDATDSGFTIWLNKKGKNAELNENLYHYKIVEQYDGQKSEGIAITVPSVRGYKVGSGSNGQAQIEYRLNIANPGYLAGHAGAVGSKLFASTPVWLPPVDNAGGLVIRATINLLMDVRFNPFEQATNWMKYVSQKDYYDSAVACCNYAYIPVLIKYKPNGSDDVYVWTNQDIVTRDKSRPVRVLAETYGRWVKYTTGTDGKPNAWGYLCYYDPEDRKEKAGIMGWHKNRPAINPHTDKIASILQNCDEGQYIPFPNFGDAGGQIWIEVLDDGWILQDGNTTLSTTEISNPRDTWNHILWILAQLPEIEILNNQQFDQAINTDDVEYKAEINAAAKEEIAIDTICGTSASGVPTARGAFFNASTGKQVRQLSRGGRTATAEELLIGTLYSQFAERKTTLTGQMEILADGVTAYTEQNQPDKLFIVSEDVQDVIADISEAYIIETRPDEYTKK